MPTVNEVKTWLIERLAESLRLPVSQIDISAPLGRYGLDSRRVTELMSELSEFLQRGLPPQLAWAHPSIESLAQRAVGTEELANKERDFGTPTPIWAEDDPIAVTGISCRFPGARDPSSFWELLRQGMDASVEIPKERWERERFYSSDPAAAGKAITYRAAFLDEVQRFEPLFFGISPREAEEMDPQQRLALELVWEALEYAGIPPHLLAGSDTGVFLGSMWHEWADYTHHDLGGTNSHRTTGQANNMIANRVSYVYGLRGPSLMVDTACSSSLVAVHLACASLRAGESTLALAGGFNLVLLPNTTVALSKFGGLARDGRSKAFDASADGYGRGEGGGVVVLKRLSRAAADGDPILCLIRGSAVNNNGHSLSLTAPQSKVQEALLQDAYRRAAVPPHRVHYVEAHGTGTKLGDPIEASALAAVLGAGRSPGRDLRIGSVKTNIGHLEGAAGIAGMLKTVLAIQHREIPKSLHFHTPNPLIPFSDLRLRVVSSAEPWPEPEEPALAGVSSFGWGGTNAHVVLEGPLGPAPAAGPTASAAQTHRKLVMVCSPQGGQWPGMARRLLACAPRFRAAFNRCERALSPYLGWSLIERLFADERSARLHDVDVAQPLLFAIEVALAANWQEWGVVPDAVLGHCLGEVVAAHLAGVLDLQTAARTLYHYSRAQSLCQGLGGMAVVELPPAEVEELLAAHKGQVSIAGYNSPRSTTLAGEHAGLASVLFALKARGVSCGAIRINAAVHSAQMDAALEALSQVLADQRPQPAAIPIYSTVTGRLLDGPEMDGAYFTRNLRSPVQLHAATRQLLADGYEIFLELSPHPVLLHPLQQTIAQADGPQRKAVALPSLWRDADDSAALLTTRRELFHLGIGGTGAAPGPPDVAPAQLLVLSARGTPALRELAQSTAAFLRLHPNVRSADVCYTAAVRRSHAECRLAVVGHSPLELADALSALPEASPVPVHAAPRVVFVFPGQGAQWLGMGCKLFSTERRFRETLEQCERALLPYVSFSLTAELTASPSTSRLSELDVVQPMLWAMQVALAAQLREWGIVPDAVVGHSMGEVAAACVSGALHLPDAARVIALRSQIVQKHKSGQGAMGLVELSLSEAEAAIAHREELAVAASNGPRSSVLAGEAAALSAVLLTLQERGVFCRPIKVDYASHSPQMDALLPPLVEALANLSPQPAAIPFFSTVSARFIADEPLDATYWARNLRAPVRFADSVRALRTTLHDVFIEISPHPVLLPSILDCLADLGQGGLAIATLRREEDERTNLLRTLGTLYAHGLSPDFARLYPLGGDVVPLPTYPWQRQRYWPLLPSEPGPFNREDRRNSREGSRPASSHPLIGTPFTSPAQPHTYFWEMSLSLEAIPFLSDHQVDGGVLFPATAYLEMAVSAARRVCGANTMPVLKGISFSAGLELPRVGSRRLQLVLFDERQKPEVKSPQLSFQIFALIGPDPVPESGWQLHCSGSMRLAADGLIAPIGQQPQQVQSRAPELQDGTALYESLAGWGLQYGPAFAGLSQLFLGERESVGRLHDLKKTPPQSDYAVHPAWLDAALHALLALLMKREAQGPFVPVYLEELKLYAPCPPEGDGVAFSHARLHDSADAHNKPQASDGDSYVGDVRLLHADGQVLIELLGLRMRRKRPASAAAEDEARQGGLLLRQWQRAPAGRSPQPPREMAPSQRCRWLVLVDRDGPEGLAAKLQELLFASGHDVTLIPSAQQRTADSLFAALAGASVDARRCSGIVHLGSLDIDATRDPCASTLDRGCGPALLLLQSLPHTRWRDLPPLWLVTRGAQAVPAAEPPGLVENPWQAPLWGVGQTLLYEHKELRCRRVDLGPCMSPESAAEALKEELLSAPQDGEDQIALLRNGRYVARLVPQRADFRRAAAPVFHRGTCLISGGLGGLGLAVAKWLVEQGARSLLLLGRREAATPAQLAALARLREAGAQVMALAVDVSDLSALTRVLHQVVAPTGSKLPPLLGVIHAAGVLDDALLMQQSRERFLCTLLPKAQGAWNLHLLTQELPLDFFVLYSSVASLIGSPGQGNYAAANAFLDSLAHYRRARGLPALCLNFGPFADVGLAAAEDRRGARLAQRGLGLLTVEQGHAALGRLLATDATQVGVAQLNARQWGEYYPTAATSPFFSELLNRRDPAATNEASVELRRGLKTATKGERLRLLEQLVMTQAAEVLRVAPSVIHSEAHLTELGLDSLTSLELRNRLESRLGIELSATLLWTYPRVDRLAAYLLRLLGLAASEEPGHPPSSSSTGTSAVAAALSQLSDEALLEAVAQELYSGEEGA
jgi:acyl transferase domain-containing protein/acyl carrier protein